MAVQGEDCYFFYNSSCSKGKTCPFRHVDEARGSDVECPVWRQGQCYNIPCPYRHTDAVQIREKNRQAIVCYWETQPAGCTKPFCPFMHKVPRPPPPMSGPPPGQPPTWARPPHQQWPGPGPMSVPPPGLPPQLSQPPPGPGIPLSFRPPFHPPPQEIRFPVDQRGDNMPIMRGPPPIVEPVIVNLNSEGIMRGPPPIVEPVIVNLNSEESDQESYSPKKAMPITTSIGIGWPPRHPAPMPELPTYRSTSDLDYYLNAKRWMDPTTSRRVERRSASPDDRPISPDGRSQSPTRRSPPRRSPSPVRRPITRSPSPVRRAIQRSPSPEGRRRSRSSERADVGVRRRRSASLDRSRSQSPDHRERRRPFNRRRSRSPDRSRGRPVSGPNRRPQGPMRPYDRFKPSDKPLPPPVVVPTGRKLISTKKKEPEKAEGTEEGADKQDANKTDDVEDPDQGGEEVRSLEDLYRERALVSLMEAKRKKVLENKRKKWAAVEEERKLDAEKQKPDEAKSEDNKQDTDRNDDNESDDNVEDTGRESSDRDENEEVGSEEDLTEEVEENSGSESVEVSEESGDSEQDSEEDGGTEESEGSGEGESEGDLPDDLPDDVDIEIEAGEKQVGELEQSSDVEGEKESDDVTDDRTKKRSKSKKATKKKHKRKESREKETSNRDKGKGSIKTRLGLRAFDDKPEHDSRSSDRHGYNRPAVRSVKDRLGVREQSNSDDDRSRKPLRSGVITLNRGRDNTRRDDDMSKIRGDKRIRSQVSDRTKSIVMVPKITFRNRMGLKGIKNRLGLEDSDDDLRKRHRWSHLDEELMRLLDGEDVEEDEISELTKKEKKKLLKRLLADIGREDEYDLIKKGRKRVFRRREKVSDVEDRAKRRIKIQSRLGPPVSSGGSDAGSDRSSEEEMERSEPSDVEASGSEHEEDQAIPPDEARNVPVKTLEEIRHEREAKDEKLREALQPKSLDDIRRARAHRKPPADESTETPETEDVKGEAPLARRKVWRSRGAAEQNENKVPAALTTKTFKRERQIYVPPTINATVGSGPIIVSKKTAECIKQASAPTDRDIVDYGEMFPSKKPTMVGDVLLTKSVSAVELRTVNQSVRLNRPAPKIEVENAGVKTFTEIMAEKKRKRLLAQQATNANKKVFRPIVFDFDTPDSGVSMSKSTSVIPDVKSDALVVSTSIDTNKLFETATTTVKSIPAPPQTASIKPQTVAPVQPIVAAVRQSSPVRSQSNSPTIDLTFSPVKRKPYSPQKDNPVPPVKASSPVKRKSESPLKDTSDSPIKTLNSTVAKDNILTKPVKTKTSAIGKTQGKKQSKKEPVRWKRRKSNPATETSTPNVASVSSSISHSQVQNVTVSRAPSAITVRKTESFNLASSAKVTSPVKVTIPSKVTGNVTIPSKVTGNVTSPGKIFTMASSVVANKRAISPEPDDHLLDSPPPTEKRSTHSDSLLDFEDELLNLDVDVDLDLGINQDHDELMKEIDELLA